MKKTIRLVCFYAGLVAVWQILYQLRIWPPYVFPSPGEVLGALRQGFADHTFWVGLGVSMKRVLAGYFISVVLGVLLGVLIAWSRTIEETVGGLVMSLQSLPSICWLPLAVLWFGLNEKAIIFVIVMGSLLAVTLDTTLGIRHVPRIYLMAGRNLGARGHRMFFHVLVPASLPHLVSGLKHGWAFAWRSLISGEMIFVSLGLGQLLMMGRDLNDMSQVIAVMVLIMAIGYFVDRVIFAHVEHRMRVKWGLAATA
jgi:NitT/TauT family transport system permease protein